MYRSLFPRDVFAELDRFQREIQQAFDGSSPSIRGLGRGGYPALNVGGTPQSVEIYAFAPGLDPEKIELNLERGVLTISGEREALPRDGDEKTAVHIDERFFLPPRPRARGSAWASPQSLESWTGTREALK